MVDQSSAAPNTVNSGVRSVCSQRHIWAHRVVLLSLLLTIIPTGLAFPLGHWEWTIWPWKQAWFMFGWDHGWQYERQYTAHYGPVEQDILDISEWFGMPVGHHGRRSDELRRDTATMQRLADYICAQWNEAAARDGRRRLVAISIEDAYWERPAGRMRTVAEMPPESIKHWQWITRRRCDLSSSPGS